MEPEPAWIAPDQYRYSGRETGQLLPLGLSNVYRGRGHVGSTVVLPAQPGPQRRSAQLKSGKTAFRASTRIAFLRQTWYIRMWVCLE